MLLSFRSENKNKQQLQRCAIHSTSCRFNFYFCWIAQQKRRNHNDCLKHLQLLREMRYRILHFLSLAIDDVNVNNNNHAHAHTIKKFRARFSVLPLCEVTRKHVARTRDHGPWPVATQLLVAFTHIFMTFLTFLIFSVPFPALRLRFASCAQ